MRTRIATAVVALTASVLWISSAGADLWSPFEPVAREDNVIETVKHRITVGETAFAEQFFIKADRLSLPLEARAGERELDQHELIRIGRGPQLRSPMRLEAVVEGSRIEAVPGEAATIVQESDESIRYGARLEAGPLQIALEATYECDGAMVFDVSYSGDADGVDVLELVMELDGALSIAYRGLPSDFRADEFDPGSLDVSVPPDRDATVWTSAEDWPAAEGAFVSYLLFGSHDRAFTWIADDDSGFSLGEETPMVAIERDDAGYATVRIRLLGRDSGHSGEATARFAILPHPSRARESDHYRRQWLQWQGAGNGEALDGLDNLSLEARRRLREREEIVTTPLTAGSFESVISGYELRGHAGGAGVSAQLDNVRLYPNSLFSVFAGPFRNRPSRVVSNVSEIVSGGVNLNYDRQILGRSLILGIGASIVGFHQPVEYLRLAQNLQAFGLFDDDETEILPYWRNERYIRYGEEWDSEDPFALTEDDPASGVYVTAYRRRFERDGRSGYKVLFVVLNENNEPVRQRFYVLNPDRVFGGSNEMIARDAISRHDFSRVPDESDWRREAMERIASSIGGGALPMRRDTPALRDLDFDGTGWVTFCARQANPPPEIYGPLFIHPRDFRIVTGYWFED